MTLMIGADPEFFLRHRVSGEFISAHDIVPGTKEKPYEIDDICEVLVDGTAVEFNIKPATTCGEFIEHVIHALNVIKKMLPIELEPYYHSNVVYSEKYYKELPDYVKRIGCSPHYNSVTGREEEPPNIPPCHAFAGGHIHVGWLDKGNYVDPFDPDHFEDCKLFVNFIANRYRNAYWDDNFYGFIRGNYYHRNIFRPKPYGVEVRSPNNTWLQSIRTIENIYWDFVETYDTLSNGL